MVVCMVGKTVPKHTQSVLDLHDCTCVKLFPSHSVEPKSGIMMNQTFEPLNKKSVNSKASRRCPGNISDDNVIKKLLEKDRTSTGQSKRPGKHQFLCLKVSLIV